MSAAFDPYYQWLGIPPEEQPAHHYRLLGLKTLESNLDVIEHAADQKMLHLRTFQVGKHAGESQRLLNEIAAIKVTLLDPQKKAAYDAQLTAELTAKKKSEEKKIPQAKLLAVAKPVEARPAAPATPAPAPQVNRAPIVAASTKSHHRKPKSNSPVVLLVCGGGALAAVVVVAALMMQGGNEVAVRQPSEKKPLKEKPANVAIADPSPKKPVATGVKEIKPSEQPVPKPETSSKPATPDEIVKPASPPPEDEPPTVEKPTEDPPVEKAEPILPAIAKKQPLPDKAARDAKRAEIVSVFPIAKAKTFEEKEEYVAKLIQTAEQTKDDPAERFALLNLAREQAAEAGQIQLALEAVDRLEETFEFEANPVRVNSVLQALKATLPPPAAKREIVEAGIELAETLAASETFAETDALCDRLLTAARALRDASLVQSLTDRRRAVDDLAAHFKKAQNAFETLKTKPDDGDAHLVAGRYLAFVKQDWDTGLSHLARGSDSAIASAAKLDLGAGETPEELEKRADTWWSAAETQKTPLAKDQCRARAVQWYREIVDEVGGLAKAKIEKRIAEAEKESKPTALAIARPKKQLIHIPITAAIDGGDTIRIYSTRAEWHHDSDSWPANVTFNGKDWDPKTKVLTFDESVVRRLGELDFANSELNKVQARGEVTFTRRNDHVEIHIHDPGSGAGRYELIVSIYTKGTAVNAGLAGQPAKPNRSPQPTRNSPKELFLDDLLETDAHVGFGTLGKHGVAGYAMTTPEFDGRMPQHALSMHADQDDVAFASYDLAGRFETFQATVGLWMEKGQNSKASSAAVFQVVGDGKVLWKSNPLQQHGAGEKCEVNISGVKVLRLEITCTDQKACRTAWFDPLVSAKANLRDRTASKSEVMAGGEEVYLDDLKESDSVVGYGSLGKHGAGGHPSNPPWEFLGQVPKHALSMHAKENATVHVTYQLDGAYDTFLATAALWEEKGKPGRSNSPLLFQVVGDGKVLWQSAALQQHGTGQNCNVTIKGVKTMRLEVLCSAQDKIGAHSVWINPRVQAAKKAVVDKPGKNKRKKEPIARAVVAIASGNNNNVVYLNGQELCKCGRDKATVTPGILKAGDVITVKLGDRFDIMSQWMIFVSDKGEPLLETSNKWMGYIPADATRWWDVSTKDLKQQPAEYCNQNREYLPLILDAQKKALPELKMATPIYSPLKSDQDSGRAYLMYVVTAEDLEK